MNSRFSKSMPLALGAAFAGALLLAADVNAKTLVLEGSDASTFHGSQPGGDTYTDQLLSFLREGSSKPVAVLQSVDDLASADPGAVVYLNSLAGLSTNDYSALYIMAIGGCCSQNLAGASAFATEIGAFYAAGGSVAIQNYTGGDWSFVDAILATPPAGTVRGFSTGGGGPGCTDGEVFNAQGILKGFTQPPALGCWEHQAYDNDYFVTQLKFLSLVDSDPAYGFTNGGSAFLALGGGLGDPGCTNPAGCDPDLVPEPTTLGLLGASLIGFVGSRRRKV
jgi:PEP-CTERM motif